MAFTNKNICKNKSATLNASTYVELSDQECSEIVVVGPTGGVHISDGGGTGNGVADPTDSTAVLVPADTVFTFRGITNSNDLSAKSGSGTPTLTYRTQFYSSLVQQ